MKARIALLVKLGLTEEEAIKFLKEVGEEMYEAGKDAIEYREEEGYWENTTFEAVFAKTLLRVN